MADSLYAFRVDSTLLRRKVRNLLGHFAEGNQAIKRANEQSIVWLGRRAAENLKPHIKRAPDPRNTVRLAAMVVRPEASVANIDGFRFLDHAKVAELDVRAAAYYRAIESGSDWWVRRTTGRPFALVFFGPGSVGYQAGAHVSELPDSVGFGIKRSPPIRITNPVPAYGYAEAASESFVKGRMWWKFAYAELRRKGLDNVKANF